jgi:pimeloyl-ACP methyl ester carboxylesterase
MSTLLESRAVPELAAFWMARPWLATAPRGDGHPVLVLPGLLAGDSSTRPLRDFLISQGYRAHGWKLGRNMGLRDNVERHMLGRLDELFERHGLRPVSLVGWSLGGLYARQLAKHAPGRVRCVVTLGSPFAGTATSSTVRQAYEWASGQRIDTPSLLTSALWEPPLVPTTSIFSRSDGICAWQACLNDEGPRVENIEVCGSHLGLGHNPAVVYAVADRLAQPEGEWKKFDRTTGWRPLHFPDPRRP